MDDNSPSTSAAADPLRAAELMGRDTPAGRALYKLYGGADVGRQTGNQHHERNKAMHDRKLATGWTPAPTGEPPLPKFERPKVAVPTRKPSAYGPGERRPQYIPHRKPGELIQKEMAEDVQRQKEERMPMPRGSLLDDAEKERLSRLMEFRGKVPQPAPKPAPRARQTERQELEALFDAVVVEIDERRTFLQELEQHGALKRDLVHQVRTQITERVQDMAKLDKMLKALPSS